VVDDGGSLLCFVCGLVFHAFLSQLILNCEI